ncbi:hypothetical protein JCM8097_003114 [Rhodosporidiobolus ruineniae]
MQASPGIQLALGRAGQGAADVPSSDSESEAGDGPQEEVYEVEEVRASRWDDTTNDWRYLVKWKGYGEDEKTWEPVENLENCRDLVLEFERMKKEREERRQKQAQTAPPSRPAPVLNDAAVASSSSDESSSGEGVGLKKFEKRRQEAKKKARKSGGNKPTKAGQVEDTVADKWEKKAEKKATKTAKKPAKDSPSKGKKAAAKAPSKTTTRSPAKQRSKAEPAFAVTTSASASKKRAGEVQEPQASTSAVKKQKRAPAISSSSESESDDSGAARTASRSAPAPRASSSAAPTPATSAAPTSTPSTDKTAAATAPTPVANEASTSAASKSDSNPPPSPPPRAPIAPSAAQLAVRKAAAAAAQRPAPSPKPAAPVPTRSYSPAVPSPAAASPVLAASAASPGPSTVAGSADQPAPPAPAVNRDSLKSISFKKRAPSPGPSNGAASPASQQNGVRFEEPPAEAPPVDGASRAPSQQVQAPPPAPGADAAGSNGADSSAVAVNALSPEAQAAKARRMREQLAGHEERLRKTYWYQTQQVFSSDLALPLACAHALNIDPHMIMRMKNRGVAVLFDMGQGEAVKGEGHALGYALLAVGAETPNEMSKVQAVCMHRSYSVDQIEGLYCELTQLKTHTVEFFHFGGGLPLQPVCATGFLIIPLRSALQLVKSVERFSYHARAKYEPMVTIAAHPATLCLIRNTQPNWAAPLALVEEYMSIVDRASIRLGTTYTNISKEAIYSPAASYLPKLDEDQELLEIIEYMSWVRVARPADYRRFIVVSNEVLPGPQARLRERGMELHTWQSATELIEENFFG